MAIQSQENRQVVGFAYHVGFDEADATFVAFALERDFYKTIFRRKTAMGQMRVVSESPATFEIWSADLTRDESFVWCTHRYGLRTYVWQGRFRANHRRRNTNALEPWVGSGKMFVV